MEAEINRAIKEQYKAAFKQYDRDGSGKITVTELETAIKEAADAQVKSAVQVSGAM